MALPEKKFIECLNNNFIQSQRKDTYIYDIRFYQGYLGTLQTYKKAPKFDFVIES